MAYPTLNTLDAVTAVINGGSFIPEAGSLEGVFEELMLAGSSIVKKESPYGLWLGVE